MLRTKAAGSSLKAGLLLAALALGGASSVGVAAAAGDAEPSAWDLLSQGRNHLRLAMFRESAEAYLDCRIYRMSSRRET
jgi:hypothetical protein